MSAGIDLGAGPPVSLDDKVLSSNPLGEAGFGETLASVEGAAGVQPTNLPTVRASEPSAIDRVIDTIEARSKAFSGGDSTMLPQANGSVDTLGGPDGAKGSEAISDLSSAPPPQPTFEEVLDYMRAGYDHTTQVTLIVNAGSSMIGSLNKLMSGA